MMKITIEDGNEMTEIESRSGLLIHFILEQTESYKPIEATILGDCTSSDLMSLVSGAITLLTIGLKEEGLSTELVVDLLDALVQDSMMNAAISPNSDSARMRAYMREVNKKK